MKNTPITRRASLKKIALASAGLVAAPIVPLQLGRNDIAGAGLTRLSLR